MPEALGKKLAARRKRGGAMDEESRQEREQQTEEEYLRKEGFSEEQVRGTRSHPRLEMRQGHKDACRGRKLLSVLQTCTRSGQHR